MESPDDMKLGDMFLLVGFLGFLGDLLVGELEGALLPFEAGESAELAGGGADIGVIDMPVDVVVGSIAVFPLARQIGHSAEGIKVVGVIKPQGVVLGDADAFINFLINVFNG